MKIGVDLGGSHIATGLVDNGRIIDKKEISYNKLNITNKKEFIENYILEYAELYKDKIDGIGIAIPGSIVNNIVEKSVNLGFENYDIVKDLKRKSNLDIKIKNDAKCAALAEYKYGCIKNKDNVLFMTLGTGIGGAAFYKGNLIEGNIFSGVEIGHMIIENDGNICNCGKKGCFETYASMRVFKNNLKKALNLNENVHGEELLEIMQEDITNAKIQKVIDEYINYLCIGISNLINIFEPDIIGIGGSFVYFSEILLSKVEYKLLNSKLLFNKRNHIDIKTAELGNDAGIIGSASLLEKSN